ncbi:MAG TPA: iron-sulfur cluster assembly scaffold protein [Terriglobia bacterium]|nr:iron-sulfur cluster assembly scaffold protein [Terriglobia bacterium]
MSYSAQVLDHFHHPRNAGEIERPTAVAEAVNPVCGDVLKLWAVVREGKIIEVKFKAAGCVPAVACGSWLAEWLNGKEMNGLAKLSAEQVEISLGGLPPASKHASALALDTLHRLLDSVEPRE